MPIDYDALFGGEDYDPCAALRALRPAYMKLISTRSVQKIEFRDRSTWFQPGDAKEFGALITRLEAECAVKSGRAHHFAVTIGGGGGRCRGF